MRRSRAFLLCGLLVAACAGSQDSASETESDFSGEGIATGPRWQWGEVSREVHAATIRGRGADADPIARDRVQYWLTAIDTRVRATLTGPAKAQMANVPTPRAFVVVGRPDAFS